MNRALFFLCGAFFGSSALIGASSCDGGESSGATSSGSSSSGAGGGPVTFECKGDPAALSLGGTWAAYGRLAVKLVGIPGGAITICPVDQTGESTMLLLLSMKEDAADPSKLSEVKATLCSLHLPVVKALVGACDPQSDTLVSTQIVVPDTLISALPKVGTTPVTGALAGTSDGSAIDLDRFTVTVGTSKEGAAMPSWNADDPACVDPKLGRTGCDAACVDDCASMRDDDVDTYPGVTVHVCGVTSDDITKGLLCNALAPNEPGTTLQGRAFLDIQVDPKFTGTAKTSCEITGAVDTSVLYNVVGADVFLAGGAIGVSSAIKSLPEFQVDPAESKFRMVRIDGQFGAPDWQVDPSKVAEACATLIKRENEL